MLKKGIVCIGCSHTWGGGLEWYSNHKDINERINDTSFDSKYISYATYKFICTNRWSRLLANKLGTWDVNRFTNSGSEDGSIEYLKFMFSLGRHGEGYINKCYLYRDGLSLHIIQYSLCRLLKLSMLHLDFPSLLLMN